AHRRRSGDLLRVAERSGKPAPAAFPPQKVHKLKIINNLQEKRGAIVLKSDKKRHRCLIFGRTASKMVEEGVREGGRRKNLCWPRLLRKPQIPKRSTRLLMCSVCSRPVSGRPPRTAWTCAASGSHCSTRCEWSRCSSRWRICSTSLFPQ